MDMHAHAGHEGHEGHGEGVAKVAQIKDYASAMPAYEGVLSDGDIVAVLSWIKSQWPAEIRAKHDQINQQARAQAP